VFLKLFRNRSAQIAMAGQQQFPHFTTKPRVGPPAIPDRRSRRVFARHPALAAETARHQIMSSFEEKVKAALANPRNQGELEDADAVGTVGSPDCGDMLRMWLKFSEKDGKRVIDRASFQAFGCQTAIAVASMATELLRGKTAEEARALGAAELTGGLGPLPPMKIHCGQLVEGALRNALENAPAAAAVAPSGMAPTLAAALAAKPAGRLRIVPIE
jgi:NifU-like protein involved in Fe-S cluster formation